MQDEYNAPDHREHDLLEELAHLLDHGKAVGRLRARTLQPVVKDRVFIGGEVELRGLLHYADADVEGVAVGEELVAVVDRSREHTGEQREGHFRRYQPPEVRQPWLVRHCDLDTVDDAGRDFARAEHQQRNNDAENQSPGDDCFP